MMFHRAAVTFLFVISVLCATIANSWAFAPNGRLMERQGYSPEIIAVTEKQVKRAEWKPVPQENVRERVKRNIWINDWIGNFDPFGDYKIREKQ